METTSTNIALEETRNREMRAVRLWTGELFKGFLVKEGVIMEALQNREDKAYEIMQNLYKIHSLGTILEVDRLDDEVHIIEQWHNNGFSCTISNLARLIKDLSKGALNLFGELELLDKKETPQTETRAKHSEGFDD